MEEVGSYVISVHEGSFFSLFFFPSSSAAIHSLLSAERRGTVKGIFVLSLDFWA